MSTTVIFKLATNEQKKYIHQLKRRLRMDDDTYRDMIYVETDGRTSSSAELSISEACSIIRKLKGDPTPEEIARDAEKKDIIGTIYRASLHIKQINGQFIDEPERRINYGKINNFLMERGAVKKPITRQNLEELKITLSQFKSIEGKEKKKNEECRTKRI